MRLYAVREWEEAEAAVDVEAVGWAWYLVKEEGEEIDYTVTAGNHPELSP